jgi:hypothetical protein
MATSWLEPPLLRSTAPLKRDALRERLLTFFERQLWNDERLRKSVCWIFPSPAMLEHRAPVYFQEGGRFLIDQEHMVRRLRQCAGGAKLVVFTVKTAPGPGFQFVIVNTGAATLEVIPLSGPTPGADLPQTIVLSILPRIGLNGSAYRSAFVGDICGAVGLREPDEFACPLVIAMFLYLKLLNPTGANGQIVRYILQRCNTAGGCVFLTDFARFMESVVGAKLPPFRNLPLVPRAPNEPIRKFRQSPLTMLLWIEAIAYQIEKQSSGQKLVCMASGADEREFRVVAPSLRGQGQLQNVVDPELLRIIDNCKERFAFASLHIRYVREPSSALHDIDRKVPEDHWRSATDHVLAPNSSIEEQVSVGHQNVLLFDNAPGAPVVIRYEPNGPPGTAEQEAENQWVDDFVKTEVLPRLRNRRYRYVGGLESCPAIPGSQSAQQSLGTGGFCVAWASAWMTLVVLNPDWPLEDIQNRMYNAGLEIFQGSRQERGKLLLDYILQFIKAQDSLIPDVENLPVGGSNAVFRRLRETGVLPPLQCAEPEVKRSPDTLLTIYYYSPTGDAGGAVFLGAVNACGSLITHAPPFGLRNVAGPADLRPPAFQRVEPFSHLYSFWSQAAKQNPGYGDGTQSAPFVVGGKSSSSETRQVRWDDTQRLLRGILGAIYYQRR